MPVNGFSTGHDIAIDVTDPVTGALVRWPSPTGFSAEPVYKDIKSEPLGKRPLYAKVPDGHKGTIDFDRTDNSIDIFFADLEARYYNGQNTLTGTIVETIQEQNGSITQFRYTGVCLYLSQAGQWKQADKVAQRVDWNASGRERVI